MVSNSPEPLTWAKKASTPSCMPRGRSWTILRYQAPCWEEGKKKKTTIDKRVVDACSDDWRKTKPTQKPNKNETMRELLLLAQREKKWPMCHVMPGLMLCLAQHNLQAKYYAAYGLLTWSIGRVVLDPCPAMSIQSMCQLAHWPPLF